MPPIAPSPTLTAEAAGFWRCTGCAAVCTAPVASAQARCPRCDAVITGRKPDAIARTWAYLLAATALYLPANLLPITVTDSLSGPQHDTLISGIVYLWDDGSWALAAIVLIASIVVPVAKLLLMSLLLISLQRQDGRWIRWRLLAYRVLEIAGRWSMLDIFVVTVLAGLVQIESLAELHPGPGAMAFGAVVVLTMLATHSFDPRMLWQPLAVDTPAFTAEAKAPPYP